MRFLSSRCTYDSLKILTSQVTNLHGDTVVTVKARNIQMTMTWEDNKEIEKNKVIILAIIK